MSESVYVCLHIVPVGNGLKPGFAMRRADNNPGTARQCAQLLTEVAVWMSVADMQTGLDSVGHVHFFLRRKKYQKKNKQTRKAVLSSIFQVVYFGIEAAQLAAMVEPLAAELAQLTKWKHSQSSSRAR